MTCHTPIHPEYPTCAQCHEMGLAVPDVLDRMEAALDHATLIAFLQRWGGREMKVRVVAGVGTGPLHDADAWLRRDFGHGRWTVPKGPTSIKARLARAILCRLRAGWSVGRIATDLDCHIRTISNRKKQFVARGLPAPPYGLWQRACRSFDPLDEDAYAAARTAMRQLRGDQGRVLDITPDVLIVSTGLEAAARRLLMSERNDNGSANIRKESAKLIVTPQVE